MGATIRLTAADGHALDAYRADPRGKPRAGLVVLQEIFGVNRHMRAVTDGFAKDGFAAIAPALFDRAARAVELDYGEADMARGRALRGQLKWDDVIADVAAAVKALHGAGKVGVIGYCWGGSLAWLAACRLPIDAAVGYYGGQIIQFKDETPRCPIELHFGEKDTAIPLADVEAIRKAHPQVPVHIYPAGHGFNCEDRASFDALSAQLARTRALDFLARHLG